MAKATSTAADASRESVSESFVLIERPNPDGSTSILVSGFVGEAEREAIRQAEERAYLRASRLQAKRKAKRRSAIHNPPAVLPVTDGEG
jgi:hypothetical protein